MVVEVARGRQLELVVGKSKGLERAESEHRAPVRWVLVLVAVLEILSSRSECIGRARSVF